VDRSERPTDPDTSATMLSLGHGNPDIAEAPDGMVEVGVRLRDLQIDVPDTLATSVLTFTALNRPPGRWPRIGAVESPALTVPAATRYPGVGPRAVAVLIDGIVGFVVIGIPILSIFGTKSTTIDPSGATTTTHATSDPKVLALWGTLAIAYYVVFETWLAATPGKLLLGLRVRSGDGTRIDARAAIIRNLLRVVDGFPYVLPYLLGAIVAWSDGSLEGEDEARSRHRRIGDRVGGTIVTYR
jgi:uncharacterized RDD family membrane protein YckC